MYLFKKSELREARRVEAPFVHERQILMRDVDAASIMYFARYFELYHGAYEESLELLGHSMGLALKEGRWAAPLRHAEADYFAPLRLGDRVQVAISFANLQETEMTLAYQILPIKDPTRVLAIGQTVHTFVQLSNFRRSPIPADLRAALQTLSARGGVVSES